MKKTLLAALMAIAAVSAHADPAKDPDKGKIIPPALAASLSVLYPVLGDWLTPDAIECYDAIPSECPPAPKKKKKPE